jgi:hypothetical protein
MDDPPPSPEICVRRPTSRDYRFLWLKYVTGVDLAEHCGRSLHGRYSRAVNAGEWNPQRVRLDEHPAKYGWYLCGVTQAPYSWADNPHLALEEAPGHEEEVTVHGLHVTLFGVRPVTGWGEHSVPDGAPHRTQAAYRTCRNWQYAHHLHHQLGVPDIRRDKPRGPVVGLPPRMAGQTILDVP